MGEDVAESDDAGEFWNACGEVGVGAGETVDGPERLIEKSYPGRNWSDPLLDRPAQLRARGHFQRRCLAVSVGARPGESAAEVLVMMGVCGMGEFGTGWWCPIRV
ncbi:MAG TPA: hypothetical protein VFE65_36180 [Pseudonocardia sp.]|nr:hypothetical protein [Pseudonocardia sp.]